jgi:hypothetical protein
MAIIESKIIIAYFLRTFKVIPNEKCIFGMQNKFTYQPYDNNLVVLRKNWF